MQIDVLKLVNGGFTFVDRDAMKFIPTNGWRKNALGYVIRCFYTGGRRKWIRLHRLLNCTPSGKHTDHINGLNWDNRKSNLRTCTSSENGRNALKHKRGKVHSQYKGVWKRNNGKWTSQITLNRKHHCLGVFETEAEAAAAYNQAASRLHGEFARLNEGVK